MSGTVTLSPQQWVDAAAGWRILLMNGKTQCHVCIDSCVSYAQVRMTYSTSISSKLHGVPVA